MSSDERIIRQYESPENHLDERWRYQNLAIPPIEKVHQIALDTLHLTGKERILDVGCGRGTQLSLLRTERNHKGMLTGVDMSAGMFADTACQVQQGLIIPPIT